MATESMLIGHSAVLGLHLLERVGVHLLAHPAPSELGLELFNLANVILSLCAVSEQLVNMVADQGLKQLLSTLRCTVLLSIT